MSENKRDRNDKDKDKAYNRLTSKQTYEAAKLLELHITRLDDNKVEYKDDMSDAKIAEQLACSVHGVARIRQELFGVLRVHIPRASDRMDSLEARIEALERWATDRRHTPFIAESRD